MELKTTAADPDNNSAAHSRDQSGGELSALPHSQEAVGLLPG